MDYELRKLFFETLDQEINSIIDKKTGKVFSKYVKYIPCPICKDNSSEEHLFSKNGFEFVRCGSCEMIYTNPQPKTELIEDIYKDSKSSEIWRKLQSSKTEIAWKEDYYKDNITFLKNYINKPSSLKLLDLGCNNGLFLEYVKTQTNWDFLGIDLNKKAIKEAERKGLNVKNCNFSDLNEEFDLITMFGVLEHIPNPLELLNEIVNHQAGKESWDLSLIVPNMFSLFHFLLKENSPSIDGREHIMYFSINSIYNLLKKAGFTNIKCDTVLTGIGAIKEQLQWFKYDSRLEQSLKYIPKKIKKEIINGNFEKLIKEYDLGLRLRVVASYKN